MIKMNINKICPTLLIMGMAFAAGLPAAAADDAGFALLVQSSPVDGGNVTPGIGVHKVQIGGKMQLTAVPRTGFRFLYWVGDVGQIDTAETTVEMSGPKLVVAVFVRERFDDMLPAGVISGPATGGAYASSGPATSGRGYGTAQYIPDYSGYSTPTTPEEDNSTLVPEVPEPATVLLLAAGAVALARKQNRQSNHCTFNRVSCTSIGTGERL
jgi:hypothetical protein